MCGCRIPLVLWRGSEFVRPPDTRRRRFEELYQANHDPVLGYVVRRTANGHDAADILAETFMTAWRRLDDVPAGVEGAPMAVRSGAPGPGESSPW
ncbi:RNA polymerase sigma factor [Sphaerisporangium fuscum]|uniref:RNA polymerase sigma factor n=1 Tax=Sphaerisporangium fuscum TaxID=2835868 RepID=UPI0020299535|nr:sigma factor [Sphaerisporangium fuscum]